MNISVIVPVYNAASTLEDSLNSILIQQGSKEFEIIIINDGSTDASGEVIQNFISKHPKHHFIYRYQTNAGVASARNAGLELATGDYLALLDADDEWLENKIEKQISFLEHTGFDLVGSRRNNGKILFPYQVKHGYAEVKFWQQLLRNELQPSTVVFKKKLYDRIGGFPEGQRYAEDHAFWLKALPEFSLAVLDENLAHCGKGKKSFGEQGLSAELRNMHKGFQKNLKDLWDNGKLSLPFYFMLRSFYFAKYIVLIIRRTLHL